MLKLFQNVGLFLNMRIDSLKGDLTNHKDEITSLSRGTGSDFTGNREFFAQMKRGQQNT
jgi:hypothetical protein